MEQLTTVNKNKEPEIMKIFFVIPSLDIGGAEMQLIKIIDRMKNDNFDVNIIVFRANSYLEKTMIAKGIKVYRGFSSISYFTIFLNFTLVFIKMLAHRQAIFHFWLPEAYLVGGIAGAISNHPKMIMSRRSQNNYQKKYWILRYVEIFLHKKMCMVFCNSKFIFNELIEELCEVDKIKLIYNGIDYKDLSNLVSKENIRKQLNIDHDMLVIVCVANIIPYKGHLDLIKALNEIKDEIHGKWVLLCIGRDDGIQIELQNYVLENKLGSHIKFYGSRADATKFLKAADISVLASHEEGFSNVILESMALGVPTIATSVGGTPEAIQDNVTGLLVPPKEILSLSNAILRLINDSNLREELGKNASKAAYNNFNLDKIYESYKCQFNSLK